MLLPLICWSWQPFLHEHKGQSSSRQADQGCHRGDTGSTFGHGGVDFVGRLGFGEDLRFGFGKDLRFGFDFGKDLRFGFRGHRSYGCVRGRSHGGIGGSFGIFDGARTAGSGARKDLDREELT